MKKKKGFELREICDSNVIMASGIENIDFNKIISLNESAALLWNEVGENDFDINQMVAILCDNYEVDEATARKDCEKIVNEWKQCGIIE